MREAHRDAKREDSPDRQRRTERTRSAFESRSGQNSSDLRVHTGDGADRAARSIHAEAVTMGSDGAFARADPVTGAVPPGGVSRGTEPTPACSGPVLPCRRAADPQTVAFVSEA